jgi:phosphoribosyl 1,2-cyclic phosphodiesterase
VSLTVCILASSSKGNAVYVSSDTTAILVDAGISARAIEQRLEEIGVSPGSIEAVCLSHEHDDHVRGVPRFHQRSEAHLYANSGTMEALQRAPKHRGLPWNIFTTGNPFCIGDLEIDSFSVPHDAYEPVGFVIRAGSVSIGIATDLGSPTHLVRERLRHCRMIVLEANHDEHLLLEAERPWPLKQRIRGRQGHLSNDQAAEFLESIAAPKLEAVFLAHLSEACNRGDLAVGAVRASLEKSGHSHIRIALSYPDRVSEIWRPGALMAATAAPGHES